MSSLVQMRDLELENQHDRYKIVRCLKRVVNCDKFTAYEIECLETGAIRLLELRDLWFLTPPLEKDTTINICEYKIDENNHYIISRDGGFLVVEPDKLISVTSVVSMSWCERKVAFSENFRFPGDNIDTLRGTLAHDLICQVMLKKSFGTSEIQAELNSLLKHSAILERAYTIGLSHENLKTLGNELVQYVSGIKEHMQPLPPPTFHKKTTCSREIQVIGIRDIEDCYWRPKFGLKGKVDCSVETINVHNEKCVVPMEFKTGHATSGKTVVSRDEHIGQVFLYALMMDTLKLIGPNGILHYIRDKHTMETKAKLSSLQSLIMARNRIIFNTTKDSTEAFDNFPNPSGVSFDRQCAKCEYKNICALTLSDPDPEELPTLTEAKLRESLDYLTMSEISFFKKWLKVIRLEANDSEMSSTTKSLWLDSISQRESCGKCIGYLSLTRQETNPKGTSTNLVFQIPEDRLHLAANFVEKDFVVIGTFKEPCVGYAFIEEINVETGSFIKVAIDRPMMGRHAECGVKFTLDKVSSQSAGMIQYVYLSYMMENTKTAKNLRNRLINKEVPVFAPVESITMSKEVKFMLKDLNEFQKSSLLLSLLTDSLLLIKGSPGCGKTTTLVTLIRMLVGMNKTVLVSAYTSNALDNILLGYKKHSSNFLRIGSSGHLELENYCTNYLRDTVETTDQLKALYDSAPVIGTTLLSMKHPIIMNRQFDYCIVDEGSQALPTAVIGALLKADKWIVFGDPNQLPALIKSREIKRMGIEENLFAMLDDPKFSFHMSRQYRMNEDIMKIANKLMYDNQMSCGSGEQAVRCIEYQIHSTKQHLGSTYPVRMQKWLSLAISKKTIRSMMFFDTELIGAMESVVASTLHNKKEKDIVVGIVNLLLKCEIRASDIGVIAPYRGQVTILRESLDKSVEVNTIDQYQGREKTIIVISFTKSVPYAEGEATSEEGILNDLRRLNVAITRAKSKVLLIGNGSSLCKYPACNKLLSLLSKDQKYTFSADDFYQGFFKE